MEAVIESRLYISDGWHGRAGRTQKMLPQARKIGIEKCDKKSSLHVWCSGMAGQAAHEDDAAPVEANRAWEVSNGSCYRK
jgi:hypothetical protein